MAPLVTGCRSAHPSLRRACGAAIISRLAAKARSRRRAARMRKSICAIALLICPLGPVASIADDEVKIYRPEDIQWTQAPALKRGGMWSVLIGNRDKKGDVVVQRIRMPPNFVICPHTHPYNETITVISGVLGLGMGTSFERGENLFSPGTLISQKAKHPHFAWTGSEGAVFQVQFNAPGGLDYVNDRDDPRKFPQGDEPSGCARG